ncbi:MAG: tetratricopeptide repeat-containing sulfotransferase family protein [Fimbriimonadaceae bacterium]
MTNHLMASAAAAFKAGELVNAESLLQRVLAHEPHNLEARIGLGMVAGTAGRSAEAIERMRGALVLDPTCVPALQWLSILTVEAGLIDECIGYARRFLALCPDNAQIHDALGRCLLQKDLLIEALECFNRATGLEPAVAILHYNRAAALQRLSRYDEAISALNIAIASSPAVEPYLRLAEAEAAMGRIDDAISSCRQALSLNDADVSAHVSVARLLSEAGLTEESDRHWRRAVDLEPTSRRLIMERAESRIVAGRFDAAIKELEEAIESDPGHGAAYRALTHLKPIGDADRPLVAQLEQLVGDPTVSVQDQIELFYALGKAYDNLGEYEAAMRAYDQANALKLPNVLSGRQFSKAGFRDYVSRAIDLYSRELFHKFKDSNASELPVVVIGLLRSGTTLAEQILSCHPQIGTAGEQPFWVNHEHEAVRDNPPSIERAALNGLAGQYIALLEGLSPGFQRVVEKNPANSLTAGLIHLAMPRARIIRMRRNLVDTALSTWMTPMQTMAPFVCDRESIVFAYKEASRLMDHWREVMPKSHYLEVNYEALVDDPETHSREMVAFCGLEWDASCLRPEVNSRPVKTPSFWQVRRPIYRTSKERWRNYEPWLGAFAQLGE